MLNKARLGDLHFTAIAGLAVEQRHPDFINNWPIADLASRMGNSKAKCH